MSQTQKVIAEYIWIDNFRALRSKSRTLSPAELNPETGLPPNWNFDGSSTGQAPSNDSEVILRPRAVYRDPFRRASSDDYYSFILVLCDCYDRRGDPVHSNYRASAAAVFGRYLEEHPWYGLEQEYVLINPETKKLVGWPVKGTPPPQGPYYCGVGADRVFGREVAEAHYMACLDAGLTISGINGEVLPGQWEFQIGPCEGIAAADQMWMARYLLHRVAEKMGVLVSFDPKPVQGDWNGSGLHVNFSTVGTRNRGGLQLITDAMPRYAAKHQEHLLIYGDNTKRLTGHHETSSRDTFSFGIASRTTSVRIPSQVAIDGCGYFEDRRPASDADPYLITSYILKTFMEEW